MEKNILPIKKAVLIFFVFACGYFISCLLRAITATLSPLLTTEFNLLAGDLGLLAGGYFLGFASVSSKTSPSLTYFLIYNNKMKIPRPGIEPGSGG